MLTILCQIKILSLNSITSLLENCSNLQTISGNDFFQHTPEIYLAFVIFVGLILVGTASFTPAALLITQKKEITLSLYEFARMSLFITGSMYFFQLCTLHNTNITFTSHAIIDHYTQFLKLLVILTT
jgi:hypothetical protein